MTQDLTGALHTIREALAQCIYNLDPQQYDLADYQKALALLDQVLEAVPKHLEGNLIYPGEVFECCHLPMATSPVKIKQGRLKIFGDAAALLAQITKEPTERKER